MEVHHDQEPDTHHVGRRHDRRQSEYDHRGPARSCAAGWLSANRIARPPEPRADPGAHGPRRRLARTRHIQQVHQGEDLLRGRQLRIVLGGVATGLSTPVLGTTVAGRRPSSRRSRSAWPWSSTSLWAGA